MGETEVDTSVATIAALDRARGMAWSSRMHQVYVRNPLGECVRVHVDLNNDVQLLSSAFAAREGLPKSSMVETLMKFIFHGWELEPGVPLRSYGLTEGNTILTAIRPQLAYFKNGETTAQPGPDLGEFSAGRLRFPITFTTAFAQVEGVLEVPAAHWATCKISAKRLSHVYCLSETLGVNGASRGWESFWCLRLEHMHEFPCSQSTPIQDVFARLRDTLARIEFHGPSQRANPGAANVLLNGDDEVCLGSIVDFDHMDDLHLSISLLNDVERGIDDATSLFREMDDHFVGTERETCCICLERIAVGHMCRRMACLHRLHAGCAMRLLTRKPNCPICRSDVSLMSPMPVVVSAVASSQLPGRAQSRTPPRPPPGPSPELDRRRGNDLDTWRGVQQTTIDETMEIPAHSSPLTKVKRVFCEGLKTLRARSWSASPRLGRVRPQQEL